MNNKLLSTKNEKKNEKELQRKKTFENSKIIKNQLSKLISLDQEVYCRYLVSTDPIQGKIPEDEIDEIIRSSIDCGKVEAEKLLKKYGNVAPSEIASNLNINVTYKDKQGLADYVYFGLYESPRDITIYEGNISEATNLLKKLKINYFDTDFNDIVLAHEIFHYVEYHDTSLYSNTRRIKLWSIGKLYIHTSPLICTGEIAGMSFAKTLLGLDFDPNILNYVFLVTHDFAQADKLYRRITKYV